MKLLSFLWIFTVVLFSFYSCEKNESIDPNEISSDTNVSDTNALNGLNYISLTADKETIYVNQNASVTALATGSMLSYVWSIDIGSILGNSESVIFHACCEGEHNITCEITDEFGNKVSKSIMIFARPK